MELLFIILIGLAFISLGVYMMYSALKKTGLELPEKNFYGLILLFPKKGQEWYLFLIGLVWVIVWGAALLAAVFGW